MRYIAHVVSTRIREPEKLLNGMQVRLDPATRRRIERVACRFGLKKADLVRNAIFHVLPEWEQHGVRLTPVPQEAGK